MLTKDDFKHIRAIVREEVTLESRATREDLQAEIKLARMELSNRIEDVENQLKNTTIASLKTDKRLSVIELNVKTIKNDVKVISRTLDKDYLKLKQRINTVEDHLGLVRP